MIKSVRNIRKKGRGLFLRLLRAFFGGGGDGGNLVLYYVVPTTVPY